MKIIDLLNKIANGEEVPEKIKYCTVVFIFNKDNCNFLYKYQSGKCQLFGCCRLNDEVEIIEKDNEIEPIHYNVDYDKYETCLVEKDKKIFCEASLSTDDNRTAIYLFKEKINELIREINKLKENKNE